MRYTITLQHKSVEPMHLTAKDWAREHCKSYVSCTMHGTFGEAFSDDAGLFMDYHFNDDKDAMWFTLRWM